MSIHSDFVVHICEMTGDSYHSANKDLKSADLTLASANAHGFKTVE